MNFKFMKKVLVLAVAFVAGAVVADAAPAKPKWLVLNPIKYHKSVNKYDYEGIDKLFLTKLVQAKKYKCLDRDEYDTAAREEGFGANVEIIPAGYSMSGEFLEVTRTGSRQIAGKTRTQYTAHVSIRVNDLRTQQPYESDTIKVSAFCETPKEMTVYVVKRMALAILMRDYPLYIMHYDANDQTITLNYGADFLNVGDRYTVIKRVKLIAKDTGEALYKETPTGVLEIVYTGKDTSTAKLVSGTANIDDQLRFYESAEAFNVQEPAAVAPPPPPVATTTITPATVFPKKRPRIAVAPFFAKKNMVNVRGLQIGTRAWMDDTVSHLDTALTQSGSFRVLDRSFGPEIDRELNRIVNDPNANPNDICRLSNKLAADYLVVAEIVFSDVASPGINYATGLPLPPPSAIFAEVRFRCVVAPTTEIFWSNSIQVDSQYFGGTAAQFSSSSAAFVAQTITDQLQWKLDPTGFEKVMEQRKAAAAAAAQAPAAPAVPAPRQVVPKLY